MADLAHRMLGLLALTAALGAVEFVYPNPVELRRSGGCILLVNARDKQEMLIVPENIVAVIPAARNDNNDFTQIVMSGDGTIIRLQQRSNPGEQVVATLAALGFAFVETVSDRDLREQERYLINVRRVTLIERKRTEAERSDTVIYYIGGTGQTASFTINQSGEAYEQLRQSVAQVKR